jgi:hypothetical protein
VASRLLIMAKLYGVTMEQIQQPRACFKRRVTTASNYFDGMKGLR